MRRAVAVSAATVVVAAAGVGFLLWRDLRTPVDLGRTGYVRSEACLSCHPVHHATWRATHHSRMTQRATSESVLGDFSGRTLEHQGVLSRFSREGQAYVIETLDLDGAMKRFPIAMTIGSRRVQQYVTKIGDRHHRLPLAWNVEEKRWFHLAAGFLHPDRSDFNQHRAIWDSNCIFCHNVKAQPRFDFDARRFDARVEELGVACEACHGPGAEHVRRNANPLRRYLLHYTDLPDPTIITLRRLTKTRATQVCGHCHGQRLPRPHQRIREFITSGDPYTPGDDLSIYTTPISPESRLEGVNLGLRFWDDGTPRLSAYEYQGLLLSTGHTEKLTCTDCHSMHGGDPRGMMTPVKRTAEACFVCHSELRSRVEQHTRHRLSSSGSDCYACHMPRIAYGLLEVHPTHRIQRPDPSRAWRHAMPEACTLCHTNRTVAWAAQAHAQLWKKEQPADLPASDDWLVAENIRALLAGDVVQRAVATMALASEDSPTANPAARLWTVPFLLLTMEDDYPAMRHLASRELLRVIANAASVRSDLPTSVRGLPHFDPLAEPAVRSNVLHSWKDWWTRLDKRGIPHPGEAVPLDTDLRPRQTVIDRLRAQQIRSVISIGE